jgi:hypothetical protein
VCLAKMLEEKRGRVRETSVIRWVVGKRARRTEGKHKYFMVEERNVVCQ